MQVTRDNIDELLDTGRLQVAMNNGKWRTLHRNGATRRSSRNPLRIHIPFKHGFNGYGAITEVFFRPDGSLRPDYFRVEPEEPTLRVDK